MKGFGIYVQNDLLEPKHVKAMGAAIWEYLWCLDRITKIDEGTGWVLGGKPVKLDEFVPDLGKTRVTISGNLNKLQRAGYLVLKHAPYGIIIGVNKAKKRFSQNIKPEVYEKLETSQGKLETYVKENLKPNKTIQLDNTVDKGQAEFKTFFKQPKRKIKPGSNVISQAKQLCQLFTEYKGGDFMNKIHIDAMAGLLLIHGWDRTLGVATFALEIKPKEHQVKISNPIQLADKWAMVVELMEKPMPKETLLDKAIRERISK